MGQNVEKFPQEIPIFDKRVNFFLILLLTFCFNNVVKDHLEIHSSIYFCTCFNLLLSIFYFSFGTNIFVNSLSDFCANMFFTYIMFASKHFSVFFLPPIQKNE